VLWIRIGFNVDPDQAPSFYLNADPDPGQIVKPQKVENFYIFWSAGPGKIEKSREMSCFECWKFSF
jgi:hypothetical protein